MKSETEGPGTYFVPAAGTANRSTEDALSSEKSIRRTIAFLGGSITEMHGFRPIVMQRLRERFPSVAFSEIAAGLSSTCSDAAGFRLEEDVLSKGVPDVLIVDEAVNDDQDGAFTLDHCIRGMEGIVRHALRANPSCLVLPVSFVNARQMEQLRAGEEPIPYRAARLVARHYGMPVADVGTALVAAEKTGAFSWADYKDCHPSPAGCAFAASLVFESLLTSFDPMTRRPPIDLPPPMDTFSYDAGSVLEVRPSEESGWRVSIPDWETIPGEKRDNFLRQPILWTTTDGAICEVPFRGRALAAFFLAGPDAGEIDVSIDGSSFRTIPLKTLYGSLHYPYVDLLADALPTGPHRAVLRARATLRNGAPCSAIRIFRLYENG